ncbi:MAG: phosphoribosyltransferase [Candidatus Dependentiae bacterium]
MIRFKDRKQAGQLLADVLQKYAHNKHAIVIGLPRGGVVPAYEIAKRLRLPVDVIVPRKIGAPLQPELAVGAVTEDGAVLFNESVMHKFGLKPNDVSDVIQKEQNEAQRRIALFRKNKPPLNLEDKIVIIVDDGVATGATMRAAIVSAKQRGAKEIVLALPVAPIDFRKMVQDEVDEMVILQEPDFFPAVGYFYDNFAQVEDDEVVKLLS